MDTEIFRAIHVGWHSYLADILFWTLSYSGLGQVQAIAALTLLYWDQSKRYCWPIIALVIFSGMVVAQGLKQLIPRDRPSNLPFAHPQEAWLTNSFPSGHTTTSFAVAMLLALMVPREWKLKIGVPAFIWATAVGVSRIYRGVHWPSDVLAGALCGMASAILVYLLWPGLAERSPSNHRHTPGLKLVDSDTLQTPEPSTQ